MDVGKPLRTVRIQKARKGKSTVTGFPDIKHLAVVLIERHGDRARIYAAMEADERLDAGDLDRAAFWRRVINAIGEMQDTPAGTVR